MNRNASPSYTIEDQAPDAVRVSVEGPLNAWNARPLYDELLALADRPKLRSVAVDLAHANLADSAAAATVAVALQTLEGAGMRGQLSNLSPKQEASFELVPALTPRAPPPPVPSWLERLRAWSRQTGRAYVSLAELVVDTGACAVATVIRRRPMRAGAVVEQALHLGVGALFIVALLTFLTGVILGFQSAYQLHRFGASMFMAEIVSLGMVREFGPLMTAIILAGRSSSAIAAELGTMAVREEIEALRMMGLDPISFLVLPRVIAVTIVQPALTALATLLGIAGGLLVASLEGLPLHAVYLRMQEALTVDDFVLGGLKSLLFAWIVAFSGCYMGLATRGAANNVGRSTTRAVVVAIFAIVVTDSFVTTLWTMGGRGDH